MNKKEKQEKYQELIEKRQHFQRFPDDVQQYHKPDGQNNFVDAWEMWYNNLDAEIMLIGQDYGEAVKTKKGEKNAGSVEPDASKYTYPANKLLSELFEGIGISIKHPLEKGRPEKLFFTNAMVGLKPGNMSSKVKKEWIEVSFEEFLKKLIEIVEPKIIITLGRLAFDSIYSNLKQDKDPNLNSSKLSEIMKNSPYKLKEGSLLFPVYHTAKRTQNINRSAAEQKADWKRIMKYL